MIKKKPFIVLLPEDPIKKFWNILVMFLLLYVVTYVPVSVCFFENPSDGSYSTGMIVDLVVDCLFLMDMFINFISAYQTLDGEIRVSMKDIAINYMTGWFFIDFVAIFPT